MEELELHPEYEKLYNEVKNLKNGISILLSERDELIFHICKNVEAEYMTKIGTLEYKAYEFQCNVLRIKRKIELIQTLINLQEIVYIPQIEAQLDIEYKEYTDKLNERMKEINNALLRKSCETLHDEEIAELKKLYRQIVKKLHPDLNPDINEDGKKLFLNAVSAYENGDLETIRTISLLIKEISNDIEFVEGFEMLNSEKEHLLKQRNCIIQSIELIKNSFPYNQKEFLEDETKVKIRINELNVLIEDFLNEYARYEEKLNSMLG